jgi:hypothetical protein
VDAASGAPQAIPVVEGAFHVSWDLATHAEFEALEIEGVVLRVRTVTRPVTEADPLVVRVQSRPRREIRVVDATDGTPVPAAVVCLHVGDMTEDMPWAPTSPTRAAVLGVTNESGAAEIAEPWPEGRVWIMGPGRAWSSFDLVTSDAEQVTIPLRRAGSLVLDPTFLGEETRLDCSVTKEGTDCVRACTIDGRAEQDGLLRALPAGTYSLIVRDSRVLEDAEGVVLSTVVTIVAGSETRVPFVVGRSKYVAREVARLSVRIPAEWRVPDPRLRVFSPGPDNAGTLVFGTPLERGRSASSWGAPLRLPGPGRYVVCIDPMDYRQVIDIGGSDWVVSLAVPSPTSLRIAVTDEDGGAALPGARATYWLQGSAARGAGQQGAWIASRAASAVVREAAATTESGVFVVTGLPSPHTVVIDADRYVSRSAEVDFGEVRGDVSVRLRRSGRLVLIVEGERRASETRVELACPGYDRSPGPVIFARLDGRRKVFENVGSGRCKVVVRCGSLVARAGADVPRGGTTTCTVVLR